MLTDKNNPLRGNASSTYPCPDCYVKHGSDAAGACRGHLDDAKDYFRFPCGFMMKNAGKGMRVRVLNAD